MSIAGRSFRERRSNLLILRRFADDPQRILAAVQRLAIVGIECGLNLGIRTAKLRATAFADGKSGILFNDSQFALRHEYSLAPNACANETAPVPEQKMLPHMQAIGFEPQVLICGYIADFASDRHHAIVEIDGPIHSGQKQYDQMRDRCLYDHGWRILRFTNEQVNRSPKAVADEVLKSL